MLTLSRCFGLSCTLPVRVGEGFHSTAEAPWNQQICSRKEVLEKSSHKAMSNCKVQRCFWSLQLGWLFFKGLSQVCSGLPPRVLSNSSMFAHLLLPASHINLQPDLCSHRVSRDWSSETNVWMLPIVLYYIIANQNRQTKGEAQPSL